MRGTWPARGRCSLSCRQEWPHLLGGPPPEPSCAPAPHSPGAGQTKWGPWPAVAGTGERPPCLAPWGWGWLDAGHDPTGPQLPCRVCLQSGPWAWPAELAPRAVCLARGVASPILAVRGSLVEGLAAPPSSGLDPARGAQTWGGHPGSRDNMGALAWSQEEEFDRLASPQVGCPGGAGPVLPACNQMPL